MTTEEDFQRALDACPEDWMTRLVFADWLEERGDGRAAGMRAMGARKIQAWFSSGIKMWVFWNASKYLIDKRRYPKLMNLFAEKSGAMLPSDWYRKFVGQEQPNWTRFKTRREAEDAAARAFGKLPVERQAELLRG